MKVCFKCNIKKNLSEFYKHKAMADGHLNKCKLCARKDNVLNRHKNIEYYRKYDKSRADLPHRVEQRIIYSESEQGRLSHSKAKLKWRENNMEKRKANNIVRSALISGALIKSNKCQLCGCIKDRLEGHHYDYSEPLKVTWLCSKCHRLFHKSSKLACKENNNPKEGEQAHHDVGLLIVVDEK